MRPGVVVGIHAHAEPARLVDTVRSLQTGGEDVRTVLLPDGPDAALSAALRTEPALTDLPQWGTSEPFGPPACFNRLASRTGAAVLVLVESGTVLGPECLRWLVDALAQPGRGLAGPSTNRSRNEQEVFSRASASDVARTAALARQRFGAAARSLEPLHSLADFCLAVRREVIEAIGGIDEGYGTGPGWEMDYNIRAARAGFRGAWVGAAYAYRHPPTERRRASDAHQMDSARQLYQDHFCGLRLNHLRTDYEDHCRGEACEHFAPAPLLTLRRPLGAPALVAPGPPPEPAAQPGPPSRPVATATVKPPLPLASARMATRERRDPEPDARARYAARPTARPPQSASPLVSCIMPTFDRRSFVPQAVRYFLRQDYPVRELVIVDDGPEPVSDLLPADPRIVYRRLESRTVLGTKRNLACDLARGSVIVHWDDDDWASPDRVSVQVAALAGGDADICGVASLLFYDPASSSAWQFTWPDGMRPWAAGASLCFAKELWARSPFPDVAIGEDTRFVFNPAVRRIADVRAAACIVALIHRRNTAPKSVRGVHWSPRPVREVEDLLGDDLTFYHRVAKAAPGEIIAP
jgi:GT2 family glycosyltransferase